MHLFAEDAAALRLQLNYWTTTMQLTTTMGHYLGLINCLCDFLGFEYIYQICNKTLAEPRTFLTERKCNEIRKLDPEKGSWGVEHEKWYL